MALRRIVHLGDPVLRKPAEPVREITDDVLELVEDMMETMLDAPGIGLAAPQIGVSQRIITVSVDDLDLALINPRVLRKGRREETDSEACLSIPQVQGMVQRPETVTVVGFDPEGNELEVRAEGLLARCLQHEIDHLDGVVFLDRVTDPKVKVYHHIGQDDEGDPIYESELVTVQEVFERFDADAVAAADEDLDQVSERTG